MEGIFQEFENENELRSYPFAAGCVPPEDSSYGVPQGVFVDAVLYPVNPSGVLFLSEISEDGTLSVSDDSGTIMTGRPKGALVELYDVSAFHRHAGTMSASSADALAEFAIRGSSRRFTAKETAFAAGCVFPVIVDGVTSVSVGDTGSRSGIIRFSNGDSDDIRVSSGTLENGTSTIRFDVLPRPEVSADLSIKRIICVVDGETPFRISKLYDPENPDTYGYNTVILSLSGIDRESVCASAHRENSLEMADTCECEKPPLPSKDNLPETYQIEEVFIAPDESGAEGGVPEGAENAFFLVAPNYYGDGGMYNNPISITLEDGMVSPKVEEPEAVIDGLSAVPKDGALTDSITSKGVVIQVPGLSGGQA